MAGGGATIPAAINFRTRGAVDQPDDSVPSDDVAITAEGQVHLMDMAHRGLTYSISTAALAGSPFVVWLWVLGQPIQGLMSLFGVYALAAAWVQLQRRRYQRDRAGLTAHQVVAQWMPWLRRTSWVHGVGVGCMMWVLVLNTAEEPFEFKLLLLMSIAGAMVANSMQMTPVPGVFWRFMGMGWGLAVLSIPWNFPALSLPLGVVSTLFAASVLMHAKGAHRFFLRQIQLEERSARLALRYRQAKEEREQALQEKNQFLVTASHDLRQPVHAMGFLIESVAVRNRDPALAPALQDLRQSVRTASQMFNSLLDLSRIDGGAVVVGRMPVRLDALVAEVALLYREEARSRGLALRVRPPPASAVVWADPALLRQSLVNLVQNALRYTQHGGVLLGVRSRATDWVLCVWDTGVGVALEDQAQIYSPFYRHEHAWRIDSAGHGLGLAVVARCADLMGAAHGLKSVSGRGSCFWLQLPGVADGGHASVLPRAGEVLQRLSGRCLIVEDDPQVAFAWLELLQSWGVDVRHASSSGEALDILLRGFNPQAVLCDQRLRAGESGFEVLQELLKRCPEAGGAMVSGEHGAPELRHAEQEGYLVLQKPVPVEQLHAVLTRLLN